jgi:hypothetical protein
MGYKKIKNIIENIKWLRRKKNINLDIPKSFKTQKQKTNFIRKTETFLNKIILIENDR